MITKGWLQICLMLCFFTEISSQNCNKLRRWLQKANKNNLKFLESKMGANIPLQCILDGIDFSPSEDILKNVDASLDKNVKVAVQEILQQTFNIFKQNDTELAWDEDSMMVFQAGVDKQIKHMGTCLSTEIGRGMVSPKNQNIQLIRLRVKTYFQGINDFLRDQQYSLCAWENVQREVWRCLLLIDQLIKKIHYGAVIQ